MSEKVSYYKHHGAKGMTKSIVSIIEAIRNG